MNWELLFGIFCYAVLCILIGKIYYDLGYQKAWSETFAEQFTETSTQEPLALEAWEPVTLKAWPSEHGGDCTCTTCCPDYIH